MITFGTLVVEVRDVSGTDKLEVFLDKFLATTTSIGVRRAEPGTVSFRGIRVRIEVHVGFPSHALGGNGGFEDFVLLLLRALYEPFVIPLIVDPPGDGEIAGEFDLSDILNSRIEVLEGSITIDIREEV